MPSNMQHEELMKKATGKKTQSSLRTSGRKARGTRIGVLSNWREGSTTSRGLPGRYGRSVRDGR